MTVKVGLSGYSVRLVASWSLVINMIAQALKSGLLFAAYREKGSKYARNLEQAGAREETTGEEETEDGEEAGAEGQQGPSCMDRYAGLCRREWESFFKAG